MTALTAGHMKQNIITVPRGAFSCKTRFQNLLIPAVFLQVLTTVGDCPNSKHIAQDSVPASILHQQSLMRGGRQRQYVAKRTCQMCGPLRLNFFR